MRIVNLIGVGPGNPDMLTKSAVDAIAASDVVMGAAHIPMLSVKSRLNIYRLEILVMVIGFSARCMW